MTRLIVIIRLTVYVSVGIFCFFPSFAFTQVLQYDDMMCPDSPNCVSSTVDIDSSHYIEPYTFNDAPENAMARLKTALLQEKRVTITIDEMSLLHAEVRSFLFRFVDDVHFRLDEEHGVIHVHSSSQTGYYDFGVNRRRIERLRLLFQK